MIFAAGLGTRMGALTRDRPKPLIEVGGRPLIDHALALVRGAGIGRIVVNTHAHPEQLAAHLARAAPEVLISHEPVRLETGGGLRQALPLLGAGPVFTLNADMVWTGPNPLVALARAWRPGDGALLALVPRAAAVGHAGAGDFFRDPGSGRLTRRGDAPAAAMPSGRPTSTQPPGCRMPRSRPSAFSRSQTALSEKTPSGKPATAAESMMPAPA